MFVKLYFNKINRLIKVKNKKDYIFFLRFYIWLDTIDTKAGRNTNLSEKSVRGRNPYSYWA